MIASVLAILLAIDPTHSSARFSVEHVFVQHVEGSVPILRGTVDVPAGSLIPRRVSAQLDAAQLRTDDPDRDDALRSAEWFDTARFPTWSFVSTAIVPDARGIRIDGMLTVHGVTQPET
ncbi:MAG TPA: YceI family protein, partial [Candidatus Aquilonibacter sp.]|nr:YceI family protein [Candidatus Aquilonibacter sp.]